MKWETVWQQAVSIKLTETIRSLNLQASLLWIHISLWAVFRYTRYQSGWTGGCQEGSESAKCRLFLVCDKMLVDIIRRTESQLFRQRAPKFWYDWSTGAYRNIIDAVSCALSAHPNIYLAWHKITPGLSPAECSNTTVGLVNSLAFGSY